MSDERTYREKPKPIHPAGTFAAKCVDYIDLGECVIEYPGSEPYVGEKCRYNWYTGQINPDTQKPFEIGVEYTVSMSEKANLRKMLESWRGKPYTAEQIEAGVPLHKVVGQWCQLTVAHVPTKQGRTFAKVMTVTTLHPDIRRPELPDYKRDEFWGKKKAEYAEKVATFRHQNTDFAEQYAEDHLAGMSTDDDLPF